MEIVLMDDNAIIATRASKRLSFFYIKKFTLH